MSVEWLDAHREKRSVGPMTLLGASIVDDESIVIVSDGAEIPNDLVDSGRSDLFEKQSSVDAHRLADKLMAVPDQKLVWGWCGSSMVGPRFEEWINSTHIPDSWEAFAHAAGDHVKKVHQDVYNLISAGAMPRREATTSFLISGFLDGRPGILPLDFNGNGFVSRDPTFVGKCHLSALFGWDFILKNVGYENTADHFEEWFTVWAENDIVLGTPIRSWEVTATNGCKRRTN